MGGGRAVVVGEGRACRCGSAYVNSELALEDFSRILNYRIKKIFFEFQQKYFSDMPYNER